ncbi:protein kinase domain-containing protein [Streptomyces sp. UG1]|uniref:protein kinase domain-containing protein n=1 Tax=Streptomyces sp. UG1 TaxID=3417652 RepID=UPI003CF0F32A
MTAQVTVFVIAGAEERSYAYRERTTCEVGRSEQCAIRIDDHHRTVSRRHCRLDIDPPRVLLRDLGSSYGTHVNGRRLDRLTEHQVASGDKIRIGSVRLRITTAPERVRPRNDGHDDRHVHDDDHDDPDAGADGYDILRELGRGSQSVVHLARRRGSGELVALKRILVTGPVDESARFALRRELATIRALRHPNIVEVRDSGDRHDRFFLAYEYCPGGTLEQLAARHGGRVPAGEALPIVHQVLSALDHAHRAPIPGTRRTSCPSTSGTTAPATATVTRGLVHRDVKPANILLGAPGADGRQQVKLADFGLAKAFELAGLSGHTRTGAMGGTIPFTPRAQLLDYKYAGPEVDVWATAACLYWLLTGATPRDFPPDRDPVAIALREPVVPVMDRDPSVPPGLARVVDEALVDTPAIAVRTARELARALRETAG